MKLQADHTLLAACMCALGIAGFIIPPWTPTLPEPEVAAVSPDNDMRRTPSFDETSWAGRFRLAGLVQNIPEQPAAPPPDPAAALDSWTLTGIVLGDYRRIIIIDGPGGGRTMREGDSLNGFTLTQIEGTSATFTNGEAKAVLTLTPDQTG